MVARHRKVSGLDQAALAEDAKNKLKALAKQVREKVAQNGHALLNQRGLELLDEMAKELASPDGMPGLRVLRDGTQRLRLQRPNRNADIVIEWHRDVGLLSMTSEKHGESKKTTRYVFEEQPKARWRRFDDGGGDVWDDLTNVIVEVLYPEATS